MVFLTFLAALTIAYWSRAKAYMGPLDPLKLLAIREAIWVSTVYSLTVTSEMPSAYTTIFALCLLTWWGVWLTLSARLGLRYQLAAKTFWLRVAGSPARIRWRFIVLYALASIAVTVVTVSAGGAGDNRLAIMKLARPLEPFTALLGPVALFLLLISKAKGSRLLLLLLIGQMVASGGKGAILNILLPVTGAGQIGRLQLSTRMIYGVLGAVVGGFFVSVLINYESTGLIDSTFILVNRILLEGDVYILAYSFGLIDQLSVSSFITYVFGPIVKISPFSIGVDDHIGAQIGSIVAGEATPTGPNPHWPVVLSAFQIVSVPQVLLLSIAFFLVALYLKLKALNRSYVHAGPLWFVVPYMSFVLQYPQTLFADPSNPFIYIVLAVFLALVLSIVLRPWYRKYPTCSL